MGARASILWFNLHLLFFLCISSLFTFVPYLFSPCPILICRVRSCFVLFLFCFVYSTVGPLQVTSSLSCLVFTLPYLVLSYLNLFCLVLSCLVSSCFILFYLVLSYLVLFCLVAILFFTLCYLFLVLSFLFVFFCYIDLFQLVYFPILL